MTGPGPEPWQPVSGEPYAPVQQPPYGQYPPQGYAQPGYQTPYGQYPPQGYPAPYPPAYNVYGPDPRLVGRPGTVVASAVLAYVTSGLLILAGALLLFGGSVVADFENAMNNNTNYGGELAFDGLINFIAAGLLIAGAVMMTGRNPLGRLLTSIGGGIVVAESIYWLVRFDFVSQTGVIVYAVLFLALVVIALALLWSTGARRWLDDAPLRA